MDLMLDNRLPHWPNLKRTLYQHLMFAGLLLSLQSVSRGGELSKKTYLSADYYNSQGILIIFFKHYTASHQTRNV